MKTLFKGMHSTLLGIISCLVLQTASAQILTPITFETPTYTAGDVIGQQGWSGLASFGTDYSVVTTNPIAGAQSLQLNGGSTSLHAAKSGDFASQPSSLSWLMRVDSSSGGQFEGGIATTGFSTPLLIVFAASGQLQYYGKLNPDDPSSDINLGGTFSEGIVYSVNLPTIDYNAGTYSVYIIDTTTNLTVASGTNLNMAFAPGNGTAVGFDFLLRGASSSSSGMVDNVSLTAVPEPATATFLGLGVAMTIFMIRRRRI